MYLKEESGKRYGEDSGEAGEVTNQRKCYK